MTTLELYRKHKSGDISREKFLYEVRRDNNLPYITNLTSYTDAVQILKNKGIVTEETKESKADEAVKAEVKPKKTTEPKLKELHIDYANPYEYRHGLQFELDKIGEYTDEALAKAKEIVLKNLAKDANFYSNLLNQEQSPYKFKAPETDAPGMQAKADGYLKKELKKDEKSNVKDNLGKKEEGKVKPKGVKVMPDKGVTGSEKTIKEGFDGKKVDDMIKSGKLKPEEVKAAAEKAMKGDSTSLIALMAGLPGLSLSEDTVEEGFEVYQNDDQIEISADSGEYSGFVKKDGKVSFSVLLDEDNEDMVNDDNWKDVLGSDHAFVKIIDSIGGDVETGSDYVQITVDADKLKTIKEGIESSDLEVKFTKKYLNKDKKDPYFYTEKGLASDFEMVDGKKVKEIVGYFEDEDGDEDEEVIGYIYSKSGKDIENEYSEDDLDNTFTSALGNMNEGLEKGKANKYISVEIEGNEQFPMLNKTLISDYLKSVIDPKEIESVDAFMDDEEGFGESSMYFFDNDEENPSEKDVEDWAKQEMSYYLFSKPDEFPGKEMNEVDAPDTPNPNELSDENAFEDLMKKYDWYYEMSDDPRAYDRGTALDKKLQSLAKTIGIDRAVELFNKYAPSDRKETTSFFQMNEDKHAKLKEILKKKVKEAISAAELIAAKQKGQIVKIPKSSTTDIQAAERAKANYSTYE